MFLYAISLIVFSALLGYTFNAITLRLIFRPKRNFHIFGIDIQGFLPRRQKEIAAKVATIFEEQFLSKEKLQELIIADHRLEDVLAEAAAPHVHSFLEEQTRTFPLFFRAVGQKLVEPIEMRINSAIQEALPHALTQLSDKLSEQYAFRDLIRRRIEGIDTSDLEEWSHSLVASQLRAFKIYGAVTGVLVSIVQLCLIAIARA